jgi:predicted RNA methylase
MLKRLVATLDRTRCWAYDTLHGVQTRGDVRIDGLTIHGASSTEGLKYQPNPPGTTRHLLDSLSIDFPLTTFIDMGSGKGRVLLVAAEYPFKAVLGVEFAEELHHIAVRNTRSYRGRLRCPNIQPLCLDAVDFILPVGPLLIHFFNPFPGPVLQRVLLNIVTSADTRSIRLAFLSGIYPKDVVRTTRGIKPIPGIKYFDLYSVEEAASTSPHEA